MSQSGPIFSVSLDGSLDGRVKLSHAQPVRAALLGFTVIALIAGCGGGGAYRYRPMTEGFGLHRALHHSFVRDGESVELQVRSQGGQPLQGLVMIIDTEGGALTLVSDANGRLAFPVSSRLLSENPAIEVKRPSGAEHFNMELTFSSADVCGHGKHSALTALARDFEHWPPRDFGPDRVYAEWGVAPEATQLAGEHLVHARALFAELTGEPPPSVGLALSKADGPAVGALDRAGRAIWPVSEPLVTDGRGLSTVVHEWTHAVMNALLPGAHDARSRYLEDGLCEVMSHLTYERARSARGSPVAADRAAELAAFATRPSVDLLALGTRFSAANGLTIFDEVAILCDDPEVTLGYGLGMAFWLEQLDHDPGVLRHLFNDLRRLERPGAQALIAASEALCQPKGELRQLEVLRALQTLRAHEPRGVEP